MMKTMKNPNSNSSVDPIPIPNDDPVRNARNVVIFHICLKFLVGLLFISYKMSAGVSAAREESGSESTWREGLKIRIEEVEFVAAAINWSALPLVIFYCVGLFGAVKEKLGLIQFYCIWLILENVVAVILIFLFHVNLGAPFGAVLPFAFWCFFNCFAMSGATQFMKLLLVERQRSTTSCLKSPPTLV